MSFATALLAPLALLLPAANVAEPLSDATEIAAPVPLSAEAPEGRLALPMEADRPDFDEAGTLIFEKLAQSFRAPSQDQVRIEQRVTIRITPRAPAVQPNMFVDLPTRMPTPRVTERDVGHCLPIAGIAGVQASPDNRLILFMRDRRVVRGELERSCTARDFYSGFYVEQNSDGQLCVKRDTLLSRSGANCKLSKIKQLVEPGN